MKRKLLALVFLLLAFLSATFAADSNNFEEIRQYFDLQDTISLVNLEMKRLIANHSGTPILLEKDTEKKMTALVSFLGERISKFALLDTPLQYHYTKKLNGLYAETNRLYLAVIVKNRADRLAMVPGNLLDIGDHPPEERLTNHLRPYFQTIDLRVLLSPSILDASKLRLISLATTKKVDNFDTGNSKKMFLDKLPEAAKERVIESKNVTIKVITPLPISANVTTTASYSSDISSRTRVMRPFAVMIENHNRSRPQTGLNEAELVYEMPVEGGITRFMAIFTKIPGLLGPVRSCREYFIDRALEVDAFYVHCGASPMGYAYLKKSGINSVDEIKHGKPFHRDKSRKAPHNLYSKGSKIQSYLAGIGKSTLPSRLELLNYGQQAKQSKLFGKTFKISYHGNYTLEVKYENGAYQRYMNGVLHVDRDNKKPLRASTIVLQVANMKTVDKVGRQEIDFIGSGSAWVFDAGKITDVRWNKSEPRDITSYKDIEGNDYVFRKDFLPIWIQVVSPRHKLTFSGIEQKSVDINNKKLDKKNVYLPKKEIIKPVANKAAVESR